MSQIYNHRVSHFTDDRFLSRKTPKSVSEPFIFGRPIISEKSKQNFKPNALGDLARLVGAEDIFIMARPFESFDWTVVYAGAQCVEDGVDDAGLAMSRLFSGSNSCWMQLPNSLYGHSLFACRLRGSEGTSYIVALLFDVQTEDDRINAETTFDQASTLFCSVIELYYQGAQLQNQLRGAHCALDCTDAGIILLNAAGSVVHENGMAKNLLDRGTGLKRSGQSVVASDALDAIRFRMGIEHATAFGTADGKTVASLLSLKRGKNQRPLLVCIISIKPESDHINSASLVIFLYDPDREILHLLRSACQLYGLAPVETELSCRLACGESLTDAAAALKIKGMTARGYLKQIFLKTGVNRQAALVQLLLSSTVHLGGNLQLHVI